MLAVTQVYTRMSIQRRWRAWLTNAVMTRWLANGRYYQLNLVSGDHKNPEYRIAEDLRIATDAPVDFVAGVTWAFLSATTFIVVLWTIGGALTVTVGGSTDHHSGLSRHRRGHLCRDRLRLDHGDRQELRVDLRRQEPGGG